MFTVKNTNMPVRYSSITTIEKLYKETIEYVDNGEVKRKYTVFAKCSDGHTRRCHLSRYQGNIKEFAHRLYNAMQNNSSVRFLSYGGFSPMTWFGEFELVSEYEPNEIDLALQEAFKDLAEQA